MRRSQRSSLVVLAVAAWAAAFPVVAWAQSEEQFRELREAMVRDFIEKEGVKNPLVLKAMRTVPRHEYVRPVDRKHAYLDRAAPIGYSQTISPPFIVAYMTESLDPRPEDKVLEIGTGSGYQAAVLSEIVKEVYSIEIVEPLGKQAEVKLKKFARGNVTTKVGDGYKGWAEHAPFDKIIVTCSPEKVPEPLVEQLKEGGRMIVPLGERYQQVFHLFEKKGGKLVATKLIPTLFVPMTGISEDKREKLPDPADPRIVNGGFEADANGDGQPDGWHYQRNVTRLMEGAPEGERFVHFHNDEKGRLSQMLQGFAVDGSRVKSLRVSLRAKYAATDAGEETYEIPSVVILFYDSVRRPINKPAIVGPFLGTSDWKDHLEEFPVPPNTREAIIRIGLGGGTGDLWMDSVSIFGVKK